MTSSPQAAARAASLTLARLSAAEMLDGYRNAQFTPRDVIDEVIAALEATDARLQGHGDRYVRVGAGRS